MTVCPGSHGHHNDNTIEACVTLWPGLMAKGVALIGLGRDSTIAFAAEAHGADPEAVELAGHRAYRLVGGTLMPLAAYVTLQGPWTLQASWTLWHRDMPGAPDRYPPGAALTIMPFISWGKRCAALRAEAKETLACSYRSLTLAQRMPMHTG